MNIRNNYLYSGYWFILEVIVQSLSIFIAVLLYTIGGNSFGILTHFISDLGKRSAPNFAFIPFYVGIAIRCVIRFFIAKSIVKFFFDKDVKRKTLLNFVFIANVLILIGTAMMIIFPADIAKEAHLIGAILIFLFSLVFCVLYIDLVFHSDNINNYNAILGIIVGIFLIVLIINYLIIPIDRSIKILFEWMSMFLGWIFYLYVGCMILRFQKDSLKRKF